MTHVAAFAPKRDLLPAWQPPTAISSRGRFDKAERHDLFDATMEARGALRDAASAAAEAAERARSLADQLDEALAVFTQADLAPEQAFARVGRPREQAAPLSSREREVLTLIAEGRSNKEIAAALYVSPNTIKTHVASLLHKLNASSRARLAAIAAGQDRYGSGVIEFDSV